MNVTLPLEVKKQLGEERWLAQGYTTIKCWVSVLRATSPSTGYTAAILCWAREGEGKPGLSFPETLMTVWLLKGLSVYTLQPPPVTPILGLLPDTLHLQGPPCLLWIYNLWLALKICVQFNGHFSVPDQGWRRYWCFLTDIYRLARDVDEAGYETQVKIWV